MYARSTTIQAQSSSVEAGVAYVRDEVWPALQRIDGCIGLSLLVDRQSGRCIATSAWQSEEAMRASEEQVGPLRNRASEVFAGGAEVEEWEIAILHRKHPAPSGAGVRVTRMRLERDDIDRAVDVFKLGALPRLEELEAFCSASLMVNRQAGMAASSVTYDSMESMERSREKAGEIRTAATREAGAEVLEIMEFELAVAHLHVPEMA